MRVEAVVVGLVISLIIGCCFAIWETNDKGDHEAFGAWCQLEHRNDLTFDQWKALKDDYLLPGQTRPPADSSAATTMATVAAMNAAASSGRR